MALNIKNPNRPDGSFIESPGCIEGSFITRSFKDGTVIGLREMLFGNFDLWRSASRNSMCIDEVYTYSSRASALYWVLHWDLSSADEPQEWIRHRPSNRQREGGDPSKETIRA